MDGELGKADRIVNAREMIAWIRKQLYGELSKPSFQRQFSRLFWFTMASYTAALAASGWDFSIGSLWGLLPPAVWVAAEEAWPTLPWKTITQYLEAAKTPPILGARLSDVVPPADPAADTTIKEQT